MILYAGLTLWVFIILLIGLRPDSTEAANCWPRLPVGRVANSNKRIASFLVAITFLLLWFLTAFRSAAIGNDTSTYIRYFFIFSEGMDPERTFEPGYQALNYLISKVTMDPHIFLIIIATIMYGGVIWNVHKYSKNTAISLCLFFCYFFTVFTSIFRQGIAMVIALYGYQLLKEGKKLPAALLFLFAMLFHTTAIVCFLLFLDVETLKKKWFVFGLTFFSILICSSGLLRTIVTAVVPRYTHYFESKYASSGWLAVSYNLIVYSIWFVLISRSVNKKDKSDRVVATNFALLLIISSFGFAVNLFTRAAQYFLLIATVEIPNILYRDKVKQFRLWLFILCTLLLVMFLITLIYRPGWNHMYPYEFWS